MKKEAVYRGAKRVCVRTRAVAVWDPVPDLVKILPHGDFVAYAQPYCDHRRRLAEAGRLRANPARPVSQR